ncbi:MAG: DNA repair protein RecO [Bacteriovoracia bacterium]
MERFSELAIVLRNIPYKERDRIVTFITENQGKITGIAKGGTHSRRFAGALDFLSCSKVQFTRKPHNELVFLDEAEVHYEFLIHKDFERFIAASFAAELCLRVLEAQAPCRDEFVIFSNFLFQLKEESGMPLIPALTAFLVKSLAVMGYSPSVLRCVQCHKGVHEIDIDKNVFWDARSGGIICFECNGGVKRTVIRESSLFCYQAMVLKSFKDLAKDKFEIENVKSLLLLLVDFIIHHVPGVSEFKSWTLLNEILQ